MSELSFVSGVLFGIFAVNMNVLGSKVYDLITIWCKRKSIEELQHIQKTFEHPKHTWEEIEEEQLEEEEEENNLEETSLKEEEKNKIE